METFKLKFQLQLIKFQKLGVKINKKGKVEGIDCNFEICLPIKRI